MKDLIRELEAERDAALATWKPRMAEDDARQPTPPGAASRARWLDRLRTWIASREPRT